MCRPWKNGLAILRNLSRTLNCAAGPSSQNGKTNCNEVFQYSNAMLFERRSITLSAVGATTAAQAPGALPLLPRTRLSPHTLGVACYVSERGRACGLSQCSTDRPAGPRIKRLEPWGQQGPGQCDPRRSRGGAGAARSGSRQVLPYLYIAYDVKTNNVGLNRMLIPI